jgi:hypothetical protein
VVSGVEGEEVEEEGAEAVGGQAGEPEWHHEQNGKRALKCVERTKKAKGVYQIASRAYTTACTAKKM